MNQNPQRDHIEQTHTIRSRLTEQYGIVEERDVVELQDLELREELSDTAGQDDPVETDAEGGERCHAGSI